MPRENINDLVAFLAVAREKNFTRAAAKLGVSQSALSHTIRGLEARLGMRLLARTTRSVSATEAGERLLGRLGAALSEVEAALESVNDYRGRPSGTLKLNVPVSGARLVLPAIVPRFLAAYPEIRLDVTADDNFVNVQEAGCDAGIRYDERLEQDMIAVPIGPRVQRFAAAAAPSYLEKRGQPLHPRDLLQHDCLRLRFAGRAVQPWEFAREGETVHIDADGQLQVQGGAIADLLVAAAIGGSGIVYLFEDWLRPHFASGTLVPVLEPWWLSFSGPFLYYPGHRLVPEPLRAFIDFIKEAAQVSRLGEKTAQ